MASVLVDLGSEVFGSSTERIALFVTAHNNFRESEIRDLEVTISTHKYILWLQVAIDGILLMQVV